MRFKDFIVKEAIVRNYKDKIMSVSSGGILDTIYPSLASKLGYKLLKTEEDVCSVNVPNKEWKSFLTRYSYDKSVSPKRFLEYDITNKKSYYFSENGLLYEGVGGSKFELLKLLENKELYNKYAEFLEFTRYFYEKNKSCQKQYILLGYNEKHRYYFCSDSKFYFSLGEDAKFQECSKKLEEYCFKLIENLEK